MPSVSPRSLLLGAALLLAAGAARAEPLRLCADPNNLPFSNAAGEGFELRLASLVAQELRRPLATVWWAQRRGFIRNTLEAGLCDLVAGVPAGFERTLTTLPYYRSRYVFVGRAGTPLPETFDDALLRQRRVGVQLVGDDGVNTPPAHALARRGIVDNVRGYPVYGDYARDTPSAGILEAVARGEIDIAIVWGPLAGWYAKTHPDLVLRPFAGERDGALLMAFSIAMGVRRDDAALAEDVQAALDRRAGDVDAILREAGIPIWPVPNRGISP